MVRQVAEGVEAMPLPAKAGAPSQMTLQLHPKDWGQLQISVRIVSTPNSPGGPVQATTQTVTAHVIAETPQVKAALENGAGDLRHALREAGLHLDRLTVTVQSTGASSQSGMASSGGHSQTNNGSGNFSQNLQSHNNDAGNGSSLNAGMSSFAGGAGDPQGRRQGQSPNSPATVITPEREDLSIPNAPRISARGQIDTRA